VELAMMLKQNHKNTRLFQNPMPARYNSFWLKPAACLLLLASVFWGCENDDTAIEEWTRRVTLVEEAKNVETFFSQNGVLKAKLKAPVMIRSQGDTLTTEFPKTLHVDFYDTLAKRESWLDARYGKYFENQNKVLLRDSVIVINIKGDTLSTSELWWDQNAKQFYTDKQVRIATTSKNIYGGKGMEASQDLNDVTIKEPTGTVLVSDDLSAQ
jgi:LPS export ABC transporter protein LptC